MNMLMRAMLIMVNNMTMAIQHAQASGGSRSSGLMTV